jgi:predicted permease
MYLDLKSQSPVTEDILARMPVALSLTAGGKTDRVQGELVTGNYFDLLGVSPARGRLLSVADDRTKGAHPVVVLSYASWLNRFGSDAEIVGKSISMNGQPMTVIGVAARNFRSVQVGLAPEIFLPMAMKPLATPGWDDLDNRRSVYLDLVARLKPGVTHEQAKSGLQAVYTQILTRELQDITTTSASFKERFVKKPLELRDGARGRSDYRGTFSQLLFTLAAMVLVVLLTVCANLANLLAARAARRRREMSVRTALGASRAQLARPLLIESVLLAVAGAALGTVVATATLPVLVAILGGSDLATALDYRIDLRLLGFASVTALVAAVFFGVLPARDATRTDVAQRLREDGASTTASGAQLRLRRALIAAQVAFSALVLVGAVLFSRSLSCLLAIDAGIDARGVLSFSVDPYLNGYSRERSQEILTRLETELARLPGASVVGMTDTGLLTGNASSSSIEVDGYQAAEDENMNPRVAIVSPGYFGSIGMPILRGRALQPSDRKGAPRVAVINRMMAEYFFKGGDPIGRRFKFGRSKEDEWIEIVGVARDSAWRDLREERTRNLFLSFEQAYDGSGMTFYLRTPGDPEALQAAVRRVVAEVDPQLPLFDLRSVSDQVEVSLATERMARTVSSSFAAISVLLASIGLYGLLAYAVAGRTRELGVRMALGAARADLMRLVVKDGLRPVVFGLIAGLAIAVPAARLVGGLLYGIQPYDLPAFLLVPPILLAAGLAACLFPAWRAGRLDPSRALRQE